MIDFDRLLKDNNINYINEVENWTNFPCPYHENGERGNKAGFNHSGGYIYCWVCGSHRLEKFTSDLLQVSFYEAKKILSEYETDSTVRKRLNKKISKGKNIVLSGDEIEQGSHAWAYLINRNFDPEYLMQQYRIKYGGIIGYWSFRIIIPIFLNNKIVTFQGRSIFSKEKCKQLGIERYLTLNIEDSVIDAKHIFYGLDDCKEDWVVLVEGPFDRWRLGPNNVLSSLGTSASQEQINLLVKQYKKVIFLFDNEKQAQQRAKKYGEQLSALGIDVEIFNPEFEHDPGDYTKEEEIIVRKELNLL